MVAALLAVRRATPRQPASPSTTTPRSSRCSRPRPWPRWALLTLEALDAQRRVRAWTGAPYPTLTETRRGHPDRDVPPPGRGPPDLARGRRHGGLAAGRPGRRRLRQVHGLRTTTAGHRPSCSAPSSAELASADRRHRYDPGDPAARYPVRRARDLVDRIEAAVTQDPRVDRAATQLSPTCSTGRVGRDRQAGPAHARAGRHPGRRPRAARGLPGPRQDAGRPRRSRRRSAWTSPRVQFTPDLLPADVTGSFVYDQRAASSRSAPGPLFTGLLLADEINRTPPKTQSALLEAMQERQVTVEGTTFPLPDAVPRARHRQNPVEYEGTYPLPEAQLDRFLLRIAFGYPDRDEEWTCCTGGSPGGGRRPSWTRSSTRTGCCGMQADGRAGRGRRHRRRLLRRPRHAPPGPAARARRRLPARLAGAAARRPRAGGDRRPDYVTARGRQGGRARRARRTGSRSSRSCGCPRSPARVSVRSLLADGADPGRPGDQRSERHEMSAMSVGQPALPARSSGPPRWPCSRPGARPRSASRPRSCWPPPSAWWLRSPSTHAPRRTRHHPRAGGRPVAPRGAEHQAPGLVRRDTGRARAGDPRPSRRPPYVASQPASGVVSATPASRSPRRGRGARLQLAVSPRRWGQPSAGPVRGGGDQPWGGYRWGPQRHPRGHPDRAARDRARSGPARPPIRWA